jgi:uncharacterized protein YndB with AHSA1/START domain
MSENLSVISSIAIDATVDQVWDALTNPEQTKKYMFGCQAISDWKRGSDLLWGGNFEGKDMVFVKGHILEIVPNNLLKYTVIDPHAPMQDIPENYLNVTYRLAEENNKTMLTVTQDGFEHAADGERRYKETYNNGEGWNPILLQIKNLVEGND